jgi:hypothetical protein
MDKAYSDLTTDAPWFPYSFFQQGWGESLSEAMMIREEVGDRRDDCFSTLVADIVIEWEPPLTCNSHIHQIGKFSTPRYQRMLPAESQMCHFSVTTPANWSTDMREDSSNVRHQGLHRNTPETNCDIGGNNYIDINNHGDGCTSSANACDITGHPFVLILPGTGEYGFGARRREIALHLVNIIHQPKGLNKFLCAH